MPTPRITVICSILLLAILTGCQSDSAQKSGRESTPEGSGEPSTQINAIRQAPGLKSQSAQQTGGRKFERRVSHDDLGTTALLDGASSGSMAAQADQKATTGTSGITGLVRLFPGNAPLPGATISVQLHGTTQTLTTSGTKAVTSTDGTFKLEQLPAGPVDLKLADANGKPLFAAPGEPKTSLSPELSDNQTTAITLTVFPGYRIQGTVFDKDTSEPLAGATITLAESNIPPATSDANGRFQLNGVEANGNGAAKAAVKLAGFIMAATPNHVKSAEGQSFERVSLPNDSDTITQDFPMVPVVHVSGRVENEQGEPVGGAKLEWQSSVYAAKSAKAVSNADGNFIFETLPFQEVKIDVTADGYAFYRSKDVIRIVSTDIENIVIMLQKGATAEGRVINSKGEGVEGAIIAVPDNLHLGFTRWGTIRQLGYSETGGFFTIESLDPGSTDLSAFVKGYGSGKATVNAKPGEHLTGLEIILPDELTIEGRVLGPDGKPAKAQVNLNNTGLGGSVTTDADGHFKLAGLTSGKVHLYVVSFSPHRTKEETVTAGDKNVVIRMNADFVVHGKVIDAVTKAPINDFEVTEAEDIWREGEGPNGFGFRMAATGNSVAILKISSKGYPSQTFEVSSKRDTTDLHRVFELGTGGSVKGRVITAKDKAPAKDVSVSAFRYVYNYGNPEGQTYTTADGTFLIAGLPSESMKITVSPELPLAPNSKTIDVIDGETVDIGDIAIGEPGSIRGLIVDASGQPISTAKIDLISPAGVRWRTEPVTVGSDGRFEIPDLDPAEYTIMARGETTIVQKITVEASRATDVVIRFGGVTLQGTISHEGTLLDSIVSATHIESGVVVHSKAPGGQFKISGLSPGQTILSFSIEQTKPSFGGGTMTSSQKVLTDQLTLPDQPVVNHDFIVTGPLPKAAQ